MNRLSRRLARQTAFQTLFQLDLAGMDKGSDVQDVIDCRLQEAALEAKYTDYLRMAVVGVLHHLAELDELITRYAKDWTVQRLAGVDRSVLRLAIFEILYVDDIPTKVSVNEAVELAKRFSDEQGWRFVNGLLGSVVDHLERSGHE